MGSWIANMWVQERGPENGIPVLVIHGWTINGDAEAWDWEPVFKTMEANSSDHQQHYRRIYIDLPAMGKSPDNGVQSLDDMFSQLTKLVDTRLGTSRFLLIGSSCGGYLARALAVRYAAQVDGLLLRVPVVEPTKRDLDSFQPLVADPNLMLNMSAANKDLLGDVLIQTPAYVEALKTKYEGAYVPATELAQKSVLDPIRQDPERYKLSSRSIPDNSEQRPELLAPSLVLCGRQDGDVGYRDSLRLLQLYPRATLAVLDRAGHDLPVDQADLFGVLVRDWLKRVEEWRTARGD